MCQPVSIKKMVYDLVHINQMGMELLSLEL